MTPDTLFEPLREDRPSEADVTSVVAAARAPRRRSRRPAALALAGATAAVVGALAALPSAEPPRALRGDGPARAASPGSSILQAAAAVAAEQPAPGPFDGYRYTRLRDRWTYTLGSRTGTYEQDTETWVDKTYHGRMRRHQARHVAGDPGVTERVAFEPGVRSYEYGDGFPRDDTERLPTEARALRDHLIESWRRRMEPGRPADDEHYDLVRRVLILLATPTTTPELRTALFGVLADTAGVAPAPEARDALGRSGRAVTIPTRRKDGQFTVIFDTETSEMLFWSEAGSGGGTPDQDHTYVETAVVEEIGDRP